MRALALGGLLAAGLLGCAPDETPREPPAEPGIEATAYPEDTVLAIDGIPVPRAEVEEVAAAIAEHYPANVERQNLRLALTNDTLERYAVRARDRARREQALRECEQASARIRAGETPSGTVAMEGAFRDFRGDLRLWARVRGLAPGTWTGPLELTGRFVLARVDAVEHPQPGGEPHASDVLHLTLLLFPYLDTSYREGLDAATSIREAVDASHLELVDPAYAEVVPAEWLYRMGAYE